MTFTSPDGWWGFHARSGTLQVHVRGLLDDDDAWMAVGAIGIDTLVQGLRQAGVIDRELFELVENVKRGVACAHCGLPAGRHHDDCGTLRIPAVCGDGTACTAHDHGHCSIRGCAAPCPPEPVVGLAVCDRCLTPSGELAAFDAAREESKQ